jgi:hypothetical protein
MPRLLRQGIRLVNKAIRGLEAVRKAIARLAGGPSDEEAHALAQRYVDDWDLECLVAYVSDLRAEEFLADPDFYHEQKAALEE